MRKPFLAVSLVIVIILGGAVATSAQGESAIHGVVKARADGSALPGAVVELQGAALPRRSRPRRQQRDSSRFPGSFLAITCSP